MRMMRNGISDGGSICKGKGCWYDDATLSEAEDVVWVDVAPDVVGRV